MGLCGYRGIFGEDGMRLERGWGVILEKGRVWVGWVLGFAGMDGGEDWEVEYSKVSNLLISIWVSFFLCFVGENIGFRFCRS